MRAGRQPTGSTTAAGQNHACDDRRDADQPSTVEESDEPGTLAYDPDILGGDGAGEPSCPIRPRPSPPRGVTMNIYQVRPTEMGWELEDQQTQKTVLRTLTKDEMYSALDAYMDGRAASVEVVGRDGELEEARPYPGSHHL